MLNKKIVITGANGFIGSHLTNYFFEKKADVSACVTDKETLSRKNQIKKYFFRLPDEKFKYFIKETQPDYLIHCAGSASVSKSLTDPENDFEKNVIVTHFILETIRCFSPKTKVVYFSSAAVYGNPVSLPINSASLLQPISPYGYHKLLCEMDCQKFYELYQIPVTILRIFSVYGPGLKKQLLWDIYQKSLNTKKVILFGTGQETRDFMHINDLLSVTLNVLEKSRFNGNVINVATGKTSTIEKITKTLVNEMDPKICVEFSGERKQGDPAAWSIDESLLDSAYIPVCLSLEDGIKDYIKWASKQQTVTL